MRHRNEEESPNISKPDPRETHMPPLEDEQQASKPSEPPYSHKSGQKKAEDDRKKPRAKPGAQDMGQ
jgi:hypothetical protein